MIRIQSALAAVALLSLVGCGDGSYSLESGTYAVSGATLVSTTDQCGLLGAYTDPAKKIGITVNDDTSAVTFNLANDAAAPTETLPTATLSENTLTQLYEANYTVAFTSPTCVVRVRRNVTGDLTDNNVADLTLAFNVTAESGTCNSSNTSFAAVPCTSSYSFTATKED